MSDFGELVEALRKKQEEDERSHLLKTFVKNDGYEKSLDDMVKAYKEMFQEKHPKPKSPDDSYEQGAVAYYDMYGTKGEF